MVSLDTSNFDERVTTHKKVGNWPPHRSLGCYAARSILKGVARVTTHINTVDDQWRVSKNMWTYHWPVKSGYCLIFLLHRLAPGHLTYMNTITNRKPEKNIRSRLDEYNSDKKCRIIPIIRLQTLMDSVRMNIIINLLYRLAYGHPRTITNMLEDLKYDDFPII